MSRTSHRFRHFYELKVGDYFVLAQWDSERADRRRRDARRGTRSIMRKVGDGEYTNASLGYGESETFAIHPQYLVVRAPAPNPRWRRGVRR